MKWNKIQQYEENKKTFVFFKRIHFLKCTYISSRILCPLTPYLKTNLLRRSFNNIGAGGNYVLSWAQRKTQTTGLFSTFAKLKIIYGAPYQSRRRFLCGFFLSSSFVGHLRILHFSYQIRLCAHKFALALSPMENFAAPPSERLVR